MTTMTIAEKIKSKLDYAHTHRVEQSHIEQSKPHIDFELFLKAADQDIKKHYSGYELIIDHDLNELGIICATTVELLYKSHILYTIYTGDDFLKMTGLEHYVSERNGQIAHLSIQHPVSEKVSFQENPQRFQEITEELLVATIVSNELELWKRRNKIETVELIRETLESQNQKTHNEQMAQLEGSPT